MINKNKHENNILKDMVVETPPVISEDIYNTLKRKHIYKILDVGAFRGYLSKPFKRKKSLKIGAVDIIDDYQNEFDFFLYKDFLDATKEDFKDFKPDLIVSNPPFNKHAEHNELYPHLFIKKTFELFGDAIPSVFIVPQWYLSNSKKRMQDLEKMNITKISTIHKSIFQLINENISVEASILYFNIKTHNKHTFLSLPEKKLKTKKKRVFKATTFTEEQDKFLKDNIDNFNRYVKDLIKKDLPDFPR